MNPLFVIVSFANGAQERIPFRRYVEAIDYCQNRISYSGGKVLRVEIDLEKDGGGIRAIWDSAWNYKSQIAGLFGKSP